MASDHPSRSVRPSPVSTPSIPEDLWSEIFTKLRVKALGRCRCVCKSWNSLLSSPRFASDHLNFTASATGEFLFWTNKFGDLSILSSYALHHPGDRALKGRDYRYLKFPFRTLDLGLRVADVIHGVICLTRPSFAARDVPAVLWNPAIRKHYTLPSSPPLPESYNFVAGFGFDRSSHDFKVVRLSSSRDAYKVPDCKLFSVRDGQWRNPASNRVNFSCQIVTSATISCFANGSIHWIATTPDSCYTLLAFNCERDELTAMDLPEEVRSGSCKSPEVFVREDGSLTVMQFSQGGECVMWLMKSYGVASSWRILFYVDEDHLQRIFEDVFYDTKITVKNRSPCHFKESLLLMDSGKPYMEKRMYEERYDCL